MWRLSAKVLHISITISEVEQHINSDDLASSPKNYHYVARSDSNLHDVSNSSASGLGTVAFHALSMSIARKTLVDPPTSGRMSEKDSLLFILLALTSSIGPCIGMFSI